jgi:4-diphosphocytidyl-2-C-methyl-D-erythritol kinase
LEKLPWIYEKTGFFSRFFKAIFKTNRVLKMAQLTVISPAKLNLHLKILNRRSDGFHNLESIFLTVDFGDILHFLPVDKQKYTDITMQWTYGGSIEDFPIEKNMIFKALSLFKEKTRFAQGFKISVEKRIPIGSGLGGGSSNAASTLLALNRLAGLPLTRGMLLELAGKLGSDVPFFIYEIPAAKVTGRGEFITPLKAPYKFFVLVNPGFSSDTAVAFKLFDEYREKNRIIRRSGFSNDFLLCFRDPQKSVYNTIISRLWRLGADYASLSGTGSTCFGAFSKEEEAQKAADVLRGEWKFVKCCKVFCHSHCEQ